MISKQGLTSDSRTEQNLIGSDRVVCNIRVYLNRFVSHTIAFPSYSSAKSQILTAELTSVPETSRLQALLAARQVTLLVCPLRVASRVSCTSPLLMPVFLICIRQAVNTPSIDTVTSRWGAAKIACRTSIPSVKWTSWILARSTVWTYSRESGSRILVVHPQTLVCEPELYSHICPRYVQPKLLPWSRLGFTPMQRLDEIINRSSTFRNWQYTPQKQLPSFRHSKSLTDR